MDKAASISCSERSRAASALSLPTAPTCTPKKAPTKLAPADRGSAAPDLQALFHPWMKESLIPKFDYFLDESDPDIEILLRQDGSFVTAFSARGATREGIDEAARDDYWDLIQAHTNALGRMSQ